MFKKIAYIILAVSLGAYILLSSFFIKEPMTDAVCGKVSIVVVDTLERHFISEKEVVSILKNANLYPQGKAISDIDTEKMEARLQENKLIKDAQVYKTIGGDIKIKIYQRIPLMRVIGANTNYYIDMEGEIMPVVSQYTAYVPLISGHVTREHAQGDLFTFAKYLHDNKFWDAQIEQIYVHSNKDVELTPRVGNHQILLGDLADFEEKLSHLKLFYNQALSQTGWNRYSMINLKYKNQIVCTRR